MLGRIQWSAERHPFVIYSHFGAFAVNFNRIIHLKMKERKMYRKLREYRSASNKFPCLCVSEDETFGNVFPIGTACLSHLFACMKYLHHICTHSKSRANNEIGILFLFPFCIRFTSTFWKSNILECESSPWIPTTQCERYCIGSNILHILRFSQKTSRKLYLNVFI